MNIGQEPKHWRDPSSESSSRMKYQPTSESSNLLIKNIKLTDGGRYKCRVDYYLGQTSFQLVDLKIIVPPSIPTIIHRGEPVVGNNVKVTENDSLTLVCETEGKVCD